MSKNRIKFFIIICLLFLGSVWLLTAKIGLARNAVYQTWPTRTPTPGAVPPTDTPSGSDGSPAPPTASPAPGNTPAPGATPVNTTEPLGTATQEGEFVPTTDPCGLPPTVLALGTVNVREGPGIDYLSFSRLIYLEIRPIIGRSEFEPWWLIQLSDGQHGWVADQAVSTQGYTGYIPIAPPPSISEVTPTPGLPWNPTPNSSCAVPPTLSSTRITEEAENPMVTPDPTVEFDLTTPPDELEPVETLLPSIPTITAVPPSPTTMIAATDTTTQPEASESDQSQVEVSSSGGVSWFLFAGAGLVIIGLISLIVLRRSA